MRLVAEPEPTRPPLPPATLPPPAKRPTAAAPSAPAPAPALRKAPTAIGRSPTTLRANQRKAAPVATRRGSSPNTPLADGDQVWVYDGGTLLPGSGRWTKGEVVRSTGASTVQVRVFKLEGDNWSTEAAREAEVEMPLVLPSNADWQDDTEDVAALSALNEPTLMEHIRKRFVSAKTRHAAGLLPHGIYTRAGVVIVAMNPFTPVDSLYSDEQLALYRDAAERPTDGPIDLPPHIFEIAARAFARVQRQEPQSIVINGESGAGKTESTKKLLHYVARAAGSGGQGKQVSEQLMRSNPALEAFGNAKTVRNDNSSRFGKLVTLHFGNGSQLAYGSVRQYLLEKTRVVQQAQGEQTYHAFYHLALGASAALRKELQLGDVGKALSNFRYFNCSMDAKTGPGRVGAVQAEFAQTHAALVSLAGAGATGEATAKSFWRILGGILHLGQLQFAEGTRPGEAALEEATRPSILLAASMLGISDATLLEYALCNRTIGGSRSPRTAREAGAARDALAKVFYEGLFEELVSIVNGALKPPEAHHDVSGSSGARIGLLDIFGSEVFEKNRFEQLLINYANDKLQNHFKQATVGKVKELYDREEIGLVHLPSSEPPPSLVLLEGPPPSLTGAEKVERLRRHFNMSERDERTLLGTLEQHLGVRVPEGRGLEHRRDEIFKSVYKTSLLQLLVDRGNYSDKATERETRDQRGSDHLHRADVKIGESLALFCSKHPAYVTAGRFDTQQAGLSWRWALESDAGGEWVRTYDVGGPLDKWKTKGASFAIQHFGSVVFYDVDGFNEKNHDYVDGDLAQLVAHTASRRDASGVEKKTVAGKFKIEMRKLVDEILSPSSGHFIRCIKPNHEQQRFKLNDAVSIELTLGQLNCCGVLEAAQISAAGFPNRVDFYAFLHSYAFVQPVFKRHSRRRFPAAPKVPLDTETLERRKGNLCSRFPHASKVEVSKLLEQHNGHAGRASKVLAIAERRHRGAMQSSKKDKVRTMLVEVYGLAEERDFVLGKSLLFLKANVLAQIEAHSARMRRCRERVGHQLGHHEVHFRMWWYILAEAADKVKMAARLADAARDEASLRQAEVDAELAREAQHAEEVAAAKREAAQRVHEDIARERADEKAAMDAALHTQRSELAHEASTKLANALAHQTAADQERFATLQEQLQYEFDQKLAAERNSAAADKAAALADQARAHEAALRAVETQRAAEHKTHAAQIATLHTAVKAAAADKSAVLAAQAQAKAALERAEAEHERALDDAIAEAHEEQRRAAEQMEATAAAELNEHNAHYEAALTHAQRELAKALEEHERYKEQCSQGFEARLGEELRAAREEERRRADGTWNAHLARALSERGVASSSAPSGGREDSGAAEPNVEGRTRSPPKRRMSALQIKEAAALTEWQSAAQKAKAKEANEIADWIETARAAKAKEAAELAEWKRKAQASNSAIGL